MGMVEFASVWAAVGNGEPLGIDQAKATMCFLMSGEGSDAQILAILTKLSDRLPSEDEIVAFAQVMQARSVALIHAFPDVVDTCGTGGGRSTFNLSTSAALVAAGAGARIAKHGNRSSGGQGSADVLEHLGVDLGASHLAKTEELGRLGITFLFAPSHHPAMKAVAGARKQLGRRSVFNLLGPLLNPAGAKRQSIGIFEPALLTTMGNAARSLGIERAVVAHSRDGLDEISPCAPTDVVILEGDNLRTTTLTSKDFEMDYLPPEAISAAASLAEAAAMLLESISDASSPLAQAVVPSAAVALWLAGLEPDLPAAANRARDSIRSGRAIQKLEQLRTSQVRS